ncbi:collectin-11 [Plakobranchus ocellatus]|uniref:Collectin-11 n=1 Tax=Plakobranchus ocellatus TaxID=259542 RepID=A0AAV4CC77_9GAST|nr:collectin-11 [Plakobranchus ocellatus]
MGIVVTDRALVVAADTAEEEERVSLAVEAGAVAAYARHETDHSEVYTRSALTRSTPKISELGIMMSPLPILLILAILMIGPGPGPEPVEGYVAYASTTVAHRNKHYHVSKDKEPFNLAKMNGRCRQLGGYLAQIDDRDEFKYVWSLISAAKGSGPFFIGMTDEASEGRFYNYNDKSPAKYKNWRWFQPDNWWNEDCVEIQLNFAVLGMNDLACWKSGRYVCEVPA